MNEATKTMIFVVVAAVVGVTAYATRPTSPSLDPTDDVGQVFFPDFTDAAKATSLEILDFDEETGEVNPFKVEVVDGVWTIPSHYNYPADSENRLGEVATSVIGLEKLSVVSDVPGDHELYGVQDPRTASGSEVGVGKRLTLVGQGGDKLVDLIIGKEVKDQPGVRYVRMPDQNRVYTTAVNDSQWTTKFADWIEGDLLKLNSFDVKRVHIDDYSVDVLNGRIVPGSQMDLVYDDSAEDKWSMVGLPEGEELDTTKLNAMTRALDDLKIVDVRRKPAGLSGTLRASDEGLAITPEARMSLQDKGFYIANNSLVSNKGQVICQMNDGVEYVLRFGEIALGTEKAEDDTAAAKGDDADADADADAEADDDKEKPAEGENRYLFVMAQFNEDLLERPELTPLPGEAAPAETAPAAEETNEPASENTDDGDVSASEPFDDANLLALADTAEDAPTAEPAESSEAAPANESADSSADQAPDTASEPKPQPTDAIAAEEERAKIEAENKRLMDEFNAKVEEGKKRVQELNDRFADWYYVISNDVYKQIHLTQSDVIKQPEAADAGAGPAAGAAPRIPQGDTLQSFDALKNLAPGQ
ncbi:MAG: DUF4340 domain-containing protein [Pirellulales bacterium]|nr:DUF4340 domain-containing protein [Planctomycetales bacterium]